MKSLIKLFLIGGLCGCWTNSASSQWVGLSETGKFHSCPQKPNCVSSEDKGEYAIDPLIYHGDPKKAFDRLVQMIEKEDLWKILKIDNYYVHVEVTTPWLRFKDDLEFYLDLEKSVIQVKSASRVGYSDFGTNRSRVENFRLYWHQVADGKHS